MPGTNRVQGRREDPVQSLQKNLKGHFHGELPQNTKEVNMREDKPNN